MTSAFDRRPWLLAIVAAAALAIVGTLALAGAGIETPSIAHSSAPPATAPAERSPGASADPPAGLDSRYAYADPRAAPPLALIDHLGRPFRLEDLRGTPVLVYFGYTHCPDVCPETIGTLNEVLGAHEAPIRVLLVTVDPERDTVAALGEYVRYLLPQYIGLTGTASQVRAAADGYGVTYARVETGSASGYAMAHTAETYLVDERGVLRAHYPFGIEPSAILADLDRLID